MLVAIQDEDLEWDASIYDTGAGARRYTLPRTHIILNEERLPPKFPRRLLHYLGRCSTHGASAVLMVLSSLSPRSLIFRCEQGSTI